MKSRITLFSLTAVSLLALAGCGSEDAPMTESEMAEHYGMEMQEYEQAKQDAAAMNMTVDQHMAEGHMDDHE